MLRVVVEGVLVATQVKGVQAGAVAVVAGLPEQVVLAEVVLVVLHHQV